MSVDTLTPHQAALELFVSRLELHSPLAAIDRKTILSLPGQLREVDAHRDLIRPGDRVGSAYLVVSGVLAQFGQAPDGTRQFTTRRRLGGTELGCTSPDQRDANDAD